MYINPYATIIAYVDNMAICEDDFGDLWYAEIPESCAEPGSVLETGLLRALTELPESTRIAILQQINGGE